MESITLISPDAGICMDRSLNSEKELIESAKNDPHSFGILYDRYYDQIYNFILRRTGNQTSAEELTSNTFFKALDKLWTFKWRNIPFSAWLYRIATNEVNSYFRKKPDGEISIETFQLNEKLEYNESADSNIVKHELAGNKLKISSIVHNELHLLAQKYREVIILRYFEEKSIDEISQILTKSEGTVKSLIHRALGKLRERFDEMNLGELRDED